MNNILDTFRYQIRTSYGVDKLNKSKDNTYVNSERELFPNCVRIEPLSAAARGAYLSGLSKIYDSVKFAFLSKLSPEAFKPFYGIISPDQVSQLGFSISSSWDKDGGDFKTMVDNMGANPLFASAIGGSIGAAIGSDDQQKTRNWMIGSIGGGGLSAISNFLKSPEDLKSDRKNSMARTASNIFTQLEERLHNSIGFTRDGNDIYGMNASSVGSSTMQRFTGSSFAIPQQISFTWYMPEQEDLFRLSIKRLMKMAYVRSLNDEKDSLSERLKQAANAAQAQMYNGLSDLANNVSFVASSFGGTISAAEKLGTDAAAVMSKENPDVGQTIANMTNLGNGNSSDNTMSSVSDWATKWNNSVQTVNTSSNKENSAGPTDMDNIMNDNANLIGSFINTLIDIDSNIIGIENVAIPFPVRLTVGNIIDIEPLVISSVKITPSSELFINKMGAHIPVTITALVEFKQWLNPGPDTHFMQFIGDDIFSVYGK